MALPLCLGKKRMMIHHFLRAPTPPLALFSGFRIEPPSFFALAVSPPRFLLGSSMKTAVAVAACWVGGVQSFVVPAGPMTSASSLQVKNEG